MSTKQVILDITVYKSKRGGFETVILHREGTDEGDELVLVSSTTIPSETEPFVMVDSDEIPYRTVPSD